MPKYSRTAKYEELRNKLQNDSEPTITSKELSEYANRLNRIDANNFESMNNISVEHDPIHQRREVTFNSDFASKPLNKPEEFTTKFNNEYMDEYINEVKQYNFDKGLLVSDNTQQNILRELKGEKPKKPVKTDYDTIDVPFAGKGRNVELSQSDIETRDRITSKMEKVLNSEPNYDYLNEDDDYDTIDLKNTIRQEKDVHEKLLNETNQMKAQMDEYEDNLTDVSDKMQHTTRILNFVLVVLIFALLVVLGVVAYMVLLNKGTI